MNSVILIGNLVRDPELRYSTGEKQTAICRFSIAVNEGFGDKKRTDYPNIIVFGKAAENCERFISKGSKVCIKGKIQTGSYEKDGRKVYTTEVVADTYGGVEFLNTVQSSESQVPAKEYEDYSQEEPTGFTKLDDEDIPFA